MVWPRKEETVTRRILEISQYLSPLASTFEVLSTVLLTLAFLGGNRVLSSESCVIEDRFRVAMMRVWGI